MPNTKIQELKRLVERSILLTEDRKADLKDVLPELDEDQAKQLKELLSSEDKVIQEITEHAIGRAVEQKDTDFLKGLTDYLRKSHRSLQKAEETAEHGEEEETLEHFFDEAA